MNRCMQWMMNAMHRVKMSRDPRPTVRSTLTTNGKINKDFIQLSSIGNDIVVALDKNGYLYMIKPGNNELNWYIIRFYCTVHTDA